MSLFKCSKCHCVENTSCCNYWSRIYPTEGGEPKELLCSECDPEIGKWHDIFEKKPATGMILMNDGFLYSKEQVESSSVKWRMAGQGLKIVKEIE